MKKILAPFLAASMVFSLASCAQTKSEAEGGTTTSGDASEVTTSPETIRMIGYANIEPDMNILRDSLSKAGFEVEMNVQPDYSSYAAVIDTGEFDLAVSGWTTVTANPDYSVRDIFYTDAAYNDSGLNDSKVNELIDKAATETSAQYVNTYTELETYMVKEMAYTVPLYSSLRIQAFNNELISPASVPMQKSRSSIWADYEYNDASLNDTRTLAMAQQLATLTSLDPIQANDGSINQLSGNINIRLMNLTAEDDLTTKGTLAYNYAIGEGNQDYYFILRDDVNFAKVENGVAVDTGVLVAAEDVVFSLNRAKDQNSVPLHKTYGLHQHMDTISIVTDMEELNTVIDSDTGKPVMEVLSAGISAPITTLTDDKTQVDNANGSYQVVKVTTKNPFPQVLNYLAHQSAGILSEEQVTSVNSLVDIANYDPTVDVIYGDSNYLKTGNNHLWFSGPYALTSYDDYEVKFEKNPAHMPGTEEEAIIKNMAIKFIKDETSQISSLRSGDIDLMPFITDPARMTVLEGEENIEVMTRSSNAVSYAYFNLHDGNKFQDLDLRQAVLHAVDQQAYIAVKNNMANPVYSTLSTVDTGNVHTHDLAKAKEYLATYQAK